MVHDHVKSVFSWLPDNSLSFTELPVEHGYRLPCGAIEFGNSRADGPGVAKLDFRFSACGEPFRDSGPRQPFCSRNSGAHGIARYHRRHNAEILYAERFVA